MSKYEYLFYFGIFATMIYAPIGLIILVIGATLADQKKEE